jgi:hypothetical protein
MPSVVLAWLMAVCTRGWLAAFAELQNCEVSYTWDNHGGVVLHQVPDVERHGIKQRL